jgi:hypothetical protein
MTLSHPPAERAEFRRIRFPLRPVREPRRESIVLAFERPGRLDQCQNHQDMLVGMTGHHRGNLLA